MLFNTRNNAHQLAYAVSFTSACCSVVVALILWVAGCLETIQGQPFPIGVQATLCRVLGDKSLSSKAVCSTEHDGLEEPITFTMDYSYSAGACRFDVDLTSASSLTLDIGRSLAAYKANKNAYLFSEDAKKYIVLWDGLRVYSDLPIFEDQVRLYRNHKHATNIMVGEESMNGVHCFKYAYSFAVPKGVEESAVVWLAQEQPSLPVKVEMKTKDLLGQVVKTTVTFENWRVESAGNAKFGIPTGYKMVKDIRDVLPQQAFVTSTNAELSQGSSPQSESFKQFLTAPPNVEELTFERIDAAGHKRQVFTGRIQENAVFFKEIFDKTGSTDQGLGSNGVIVSRYESNTWVGRHDRLLTSTAPVVPLPKTGGRIDSMSRIQNVAQNILCEPLRMGILFAVFKTFEWHGNQFTADDRDGGTLGGHLELDRLGWPMRVVYTRDMTKEAYEVDYKYATNALTSDIPCEMTLRFPNQSQHIRSKPYKLYRILSFKQAHSPMPKAKFALDDLAHGSKGVPEIVYSNHMAYQQIGGMLRLVERSRDGSWSFRTLAPRLAVCATMIISFIAFSAVLIRSIVRYKQLKKQSNT